MTEEKDVKMSDTAKKVSQVLGDLNEKESKQSKFSNFLKELDVSKKQFFTFVVVLLVFVVIVVYSFFAIFNLFKPESEEVDFRAEKSTEKLVEDRKIEPTVQKNILPKDLVQVNLKFDFLNLPLTLGSKISDQVNLDFHARIFSELKALHEVDVFAYLDNFDNRHLAFDEYVKKLEAGLAKVGVLLSDLQRETAVLEASIAELELKAKDAESEFFQASDDLLVGKIDKNLLLFQSLNIRIAELKPLLKGRQIFVKRYGDVLELVPEKLASVKANEEALVKAVKIQNVNNFDLNLIQP